MPDHDSENLLVRLNCKCPVCRPGRDLSVQPGHDPVRYPYPWDRKPVAVTFRDGYG